MNSIVQNDSDLIERLVLQKNNQKYIKKLIPLYKEFVQRCAGLNKFLNLNDPIIIYTIYHLLLFDGFFSKDKTFIYSERDVSDIFKVWGSQVVNGTGVCRHIAPLFNDILKALNFSSALLPIYDHKEDKLDIDKVDEESVYQIIDWLLKHDLDDEEEDEILEEVKRAKDESKSFHLEMEIPSSAKKRGNHLIVLVLKDNFSYFLDPTNFITFTNIGNDELSYDEGIVSVRRFYSFDFNPLKDYTIIHRGLELPSVSLEPDEALEIYQDNQSVFENFFESNRPLYCAMSKTLSKIRT